MQQVKLKETFKYQESNQDTTKMLKSAIMTIQISFSATVLLSSQPIITAMDKICNIQAEQWSNQKLLTIVRKRLRDRQY